MSKMGKGVSINSVKIKKNKHELESPRHIRNRFATAGKKPVSRIDIPGVESVLRNGKKYPVQAKTYLDSNKSNLLADDVSKKNMQDAREVINQQKEKQVISRPPVKTINPGNASIRLDSQPAGSPGFRNLQLQINGKTKRAKTSIGSAYGPAALYDNHYKIPVKALKLSLKNQLPAYTIPSPLSSQE